MKKVRHKLHTFFPDRQLPKPLSREQIKKLIQEEDVDGLVECHLRLVIRLVSSYGDDDELISDALFMLLKSVKSFLAKADEDQNITNWIYTRVNFQLIETIKIRSAIKQSWPTVRRRGLIKSQSLAEEILQPRSLHRVETREILQLACDNPQEWSIFEAHLQGYKPKEIAQRLSIPQYRVNRLLRGIIERLSIIWKEQNED